MRSIEPLRKPTICVLPGDGIGPEVVDAAIPVLSELGVNCDLKFADVGWECWKKHGDTVPEETWKSIRSCDVTLLGAVTSMPLKEALAALPIELQNNPPDFISPVIQLRQNLELYANIRPVSDILGGGRFRFAVIRENTEGLYSGLDFYPPPADFNRLLEAREKKPHSWSRRSSEDYAVSMRLLTRDGIERLLILAFEYAVQHGYQTVTWADKPNVLRNSGNFARESAENVAARYPHVTFNIENVDAVALWMIRRPERFGVIAAENMFGDILSDVGAGVMGGLGLAASENIGLKSSYFEPVHGSAPKYAGLNKANPVAMFLTIALMLERLGFKDEASAIVRSVKHVLLSGRRTFDLGGSCSTREVAVAIISEAASS